MLIDCLQTRTENYALTQLATTPEILHGQGRSYKTSLAKYTDFTEGAWHGDVFPTLNYGLAMTQNHAVVWHCGQASTAPNAPDPLKIRLLNPSNNPRHPLPLGILVPTSNEPALLVVMPVSGKFTYWDSLSDAAHRDPNRQRQQSIQGSIGGMSSTETAVEITEAEPRGFVVTMSTGRLVHLAIVDTQGKSTIQSKYLQNPGVQGAGVFGSLRSVFSSAAWRRDVAAVRAAHSLRRGQRYMVTATVSGSFQVWDMDWNGSQSGVYELDATEDLLKALSEGEQSFHAYQRHILELIDFTIITDAGKKQRLAQSSDNATIRLMALTAIKGQESTKYALVGLTLRTGSVDIEVVHPISCYETPTPFTIRPKPKVLVSELAEVAFVVFERSLIMISLTEVEESPNSQLQMEAHTLPEPFQDVLDFRKDRVYRGVGCSTESSDGNQGSASIIVMVLGFGLVRLTVFSNPKGQTTPQRNSVSAQTKIEQAVFFGGLEQDLLDFSPRPEKNFTIKDVEEAALNISHSIMSSTSNYLPSMGPSMKQQLSRRASSLVDLNKHIRQNYPMVSRRIRWQLLWNAEKMASAQMLWEVYQTAVGTPNQTSESKNVLTELVETIHPRYKIENQPENNETDGVRHWFVHDVWRIEWVVAYAEEVVELLFKESVEDNQEYDLPTRARLIIEATDIQLAVLETAFRFREANIPAYGLEADKTSDGILTEGYADLPEVWTSTQAIVAKVKMLTDISRETAIALDDPDEGAPADDPLSETYLYKLAEDNPRQVHVCCQVFMERYRWLESRTAAESQRDGANLKSSYIAVRRGLLRQLPQIGQTQGAIDLAEKYHDMKALVEVLEIEMHNAENATEQEELINRISQYFVKYGAQWADAFFSRHLDGADSVRILNQTALFKQHLTKFLRTHKRYASIGWINEILAEENFERASSFLREAGEQTSNLWSQKIALSMRKLTLLAAKSEGQTAESTVVQTSKAIDQTLDTLDIQDKIYAHIKPAVRDALDAEAEVDLAVQRFAHTFVGEKPTLQSILRSDLQKLLVYQTLPPDDLIDLLTLVEPDSLTQETPPMTYRFFSALQVLYLSTSVSPSNHAVLEAIIWRRCLIQDDWSALNRTESKSDAEVTAETTLTSLHATLLAGFRTSPPFWDAHPTMPPDNAILLEAGTSTASLRSLTRYADTPDHTLTSLASDHQQEADALTDSLEKGRLATWWAGIVESARTSARAEADADGEALAEKVALGREMREQEKEAEKTRRFIGLGMDGAIDNDGWQRDADADAEGDGYDEYGIPIASTSPKPSKNRLRNSGGSTSRPVSRDGLGSSSARESLPGQLDIWSD